MADTHSTNALDQAPVGTVQEDKIDLRAIFGFAIGLAVVIIVVDVAMVLWFNMGVRAIDASNPPKVFPLASLPDERRPPEPRLQEFGEPRQDLKNLRSAEDEILNGYSWVDRNRNIVRIPVADAMKLTLQRGLPAREQAATGTPATQSTQGTSK